MPQNDVVVDSNIMSTYGTKMGSCHVAMFEWLMCCGGLCTSSHIINEYFRQGSPLVAALINTLTSRGRLSRIDNLTINSFSADKRHSYTCNAADIPVARTCFKSFRKILVSNDQRLRNDVNGFPKQGGIKPAAFEKLPQDYFSCTARAPCHAKQHPVL